jgi:hypothetical protein
MKLHNAVGSALVAAGLIALPTLGYAAKSVEIEVNQAPPPPPTVSVEVKPESRAGQVYVPGHYEYESSKYVWRDPAYIQERPGRKYEFSSIEKKGDKWVYKRGHWDDE